jgi:hypothetical protein
MDEANAMTDIISTYGAFVLFGLSLGAYGWLALAYGMAFRYSRRFIHLQQMFSWIGGGSVSLLVFSVLREIGGLWWQRGMFGAVITLLPMVALWQRWSGRVNEPGYASARELLSLHRPGAHPASGDGAAGLFVPSNIEPDTRALFRWRGVLGGLGILASIVVIMWILSIFGF